MTEHRLKIDPEKSELIHHTWQNNDHKARDNQPPAIDTPVTIRHIGNQQPTIIRPTKTIKWLGMIFDTKLTFQKHLKTTSTQATNTLNSLNMLGNSVRGLHLPTPCTRCYPTNGALHKPSLVEQHGQPGKTC